MRLFVTFLATAALATFSQLATAAPVDEARKCLDQYDGSFAPNGPESVRAECRTFMFPPRPDNPKGMHQFAGNVVREVALTCRATYGQRVNLEREIPTACRVFYFPIPGKKDAAITIPPKESGGLF